MVSGEAKAHVHGWLGRQLGWSGKIFFSPVLPAVKEMQPLIGQGPQLCLTCNSHFEQLRKQSRAVLNLSGPLCLKYRLRVLGKKGLCGETKQDQGTDSTLRPE